MPSSRLIKTLLVAVMALFLAACGGGGGGGGGGQGGGTGGGGGGGDTGGGGGGDTNDDPLGPVGTLEEEQDRLFLTIGMQIIEPGYSAMKVSMDDLATSATQYCADPANGDLAALNEAWRQAMLDWQAIEIVRFGPVEEDARRLRLQFFPDANDAVVNNTTQILDGMDPIDEALVASSPVGAQGLPAIEYLLFELGGLDDAVNGSRRCELLVAVAQNLATIAGELATAWSASGQLMADFTSASGVYMDRVEVLTEVLESMALETEFVADEKITRPLAVGAASAESFRSENSLANLEANAAALRQWLDLGPEDTDYGLSDYLRRAEEADSISNQLDDQLTVIEDNIVAIDETLEQLILTDPSAAAIDAVRSTMQDLADSFIDAAIAADVSLGFNNQDGD
ncbi:MAG: imelysin family protein [Pseudomonadota bacterium]